jgi:pimeloyl-ACP methyl ester carboxylesterase
MNRSIGRNAHSTQHWFRQNSAHSPAHTKGVSPRSRSLNTSTLPTGGALRCGQSGRVQARQPRPMGVDWFNDFQRKTVSSHNAAPFLDLFGNIDVRAHLSAIKVPALIFHARDDQRIGIEQAIELAASIKGASLVTLDTDNHILRAHEPAMEIVLERIRGFLAG